MTNDGTVSGSLRGAGAVEAETRPGAGARIAPFIGSLAARLLGAVLLVAAYAKGLDPHLFADQLRDLLGLPAGPAFAAAIAIVGFEAGLGAALLLGWRHWVVLAVTTATFAWFTAVVTWQLFYPSEAAGGCGCFGALVERTPQEALLEDLGFLALCGLAWIGRTAAAAASRWGVTIIATVAGVAWAIAGPALPLDDQATALAPGVPVATTRLDEVVPQLRTGRHLVLLLDRTDADTRARIAPLNQRLKLPGGPLSVWGFALDDAGQAAEFLWTAGPAFEVRGVPPAMLRRLYRTLPRSALIDGGQVVETWSGWPPDSALDALVRGDSR